MIAPSISSTSRIGFAHQPQTFEPGISGKMKENMVELSLQDKLGVYVPLRFAEVKKEERELIPTKGTESN